MLLSCGHAVEVWVTVYDCGYPWVTVAKRSPTVALLPSLHYCCLQEDVRKLESEIHRFQNLVGDADHPVEEIWSGHAGWKWEKSPEGNWVPVRNRHPGEGGMHRMAGQGRWTQPLGYRVHKLFMTWIEEDMDVVKRLSGGDVMVPSAGGSGPAPAAQVRVRLF